MGELGWDFLVTCWRCSVPRIYIFGGCVASAPPSPVPASCTCLLPKLFFPNDHPTAISLFNVLFAGPCLRCAAGGVSLWMLLSRDWHFPPPISVPLRSTARFLQFLSLATGDKRCVPAQRLAIVRWWHILLCGHVVVRWWRDYRVPLEVRRAGAYGCCARRCARLFLLAGCA